VLNYNFIAPQRHYEVINRPGRCQWNAATSVIAFAEVTGNGLDVGYLRRAARADSRYGPANEVKADDDCSR